MVKVIFQAVGDNVKLAVRREGESRKKVDIQSLPSETTEEVEGNGVFVTAVDISLAGGKPLNDIHAWTNALRELKIGGSTIESGSVIVGNIRITKEG